MLPILIGVVEQKGIARLNCFQAVFIAYPVQCGRQGVHLNRRALRLGDRIAVLDQGRLVQIGTPRTLMREPADDSVRKLLDTPRREARLVDDLLSEQAGT